MAARIFKVFIVLTITIGLISITQSCGVYSFQGVTTAAKTISITEFYNNADLGPANMGQTFTNDLKNYFIKNSNISVVQEEGELQMDGEIMDFRVTPISPVSSGNNTELDNAASTRLTITIKVTYVSTIPQEEEMGFKDKTFSFYKDFPNDQNLADVEDQYVKEIFERLVNDIFNASVANW